MKVRVIAASSVVPKIEFELGLQKLKELGFDVDVADNLLAQEFAYAGDVRTRAQQFFNAAQSSAQVCWAVRGGYGANQILPLLVKLSENQPAPSGKLLIGYSDLTALYQFLSEHWGWRIMHAPMISSKDFREMSKEDQQSLLALIEQRNSETKPWQKQPLQWINHATIEHDAISAPLFGGNLSVICAMIGTAWQLDFKDKILFLEDVAESWCKIERMLDQLYLAGCLDECKAIVLGRFTHCRDSSPVGLKEIPKNQHSDQKEAIRVVLTEQQAMHRVFGLLADKLNIPVAYGLCVGHFDENAALPLLANYRLSFDQGLELISWP